MRGGVVIPAIVVTIDLQVDLRMLPFQRDYRVDEVIKAFNIGQPGDRDQLSRRPLTEWDLLL